MGKGRVPGTVPVSLDRKGQSIWGYPHLLGWKVAEYLGYTQVLCGSAVSMTQLQTLLSRHLPLRILLQRFWLNPYLCCLSSWICRLPPSSCSYPSALWLTHCIICFSITPCTSAFSQERFKLVYNLYFPTPEMAPSLSYTTDLIKSFSGN